MSIEYMTGIYIKETTKMNDNIIRGSNINTTFARLLVGGRCDLALNCEDCGARHVPVYYCKSPDIRAYRDTLCLFRKIGSLIFDLKIVR